MVIPIQNLVFVIPSLVMVAVVKARGRSWEHALGLVGFRWAAARYFLLGVLMGLLAGGSVFLISPEVPSVLIDNPNVATSRYADMPRSFSSFVTALLIESVFVALGEEIFFRGFLGRMLVRGLEFQVGNFMQACIFLLPHLLILTISTTLWPILIPQFIAGWMYGWLTHRSDSIVPSWIAHALSNAFAALPFMA